MRDIIDIGNEMSQKLKKWILDKWTKNVQCVFK